MPKQKNSVGYFSAYYRGLECLLAMWPEIRKQVPKATLDIYYGWQSWLALEGENEFYHRMVAKIDELKDQGVTDHGRVSHAELAKAMEKIEVWAYPTSFSEIDCITAKKINMAGCRPVLTDVAALKENKGPHAFVVESDRIYSDEYAQKKFVDKAVYALKNPLTKAEIKEQQEWASQFEWSKIAKEWAKVINA